jgi:hypothetical protein
MKIQLELNAKCRNCIHWHFETEDMMDYLEDGETYCELDNKKRKEQEECERLELDTFNLKSNLASAGFQRVKIK